MAKITYIADGRKNSKKNPAKLTLNLHLDCGETVSLDLIYKKGEGWLPSEDASARAVYLYCVYVSHDRCWTDALLQNYINAYYNQVFTNRPEAARSNVIVSYFQWRDSFEKGTVEVLWWSLEKDEVNE